MHVLLVCFERRPIVACAAESDTEISGYTPADFISYSEDPQHSCYHVTEAVVAAPVDVCFAFWNEWQRLVDFLDLIGQIGLDDKSPDMALFQCYYRWAKLPVMEITFLLQKTVAEPGRRIDFHSVWGMPLHGNVQLSDEPDAGAGGAPRTRVRLEFTHPIPNLLVELKIGTFGIESHMQEILKENMQDYKAAVEAAAGTPPPGAAPAPGPGEKAPGALRRRTEGLKREQEQRAEGAAGPSGRGAEAGEGRQRRSRAASGAGKAAAVGDDAAAAAPKRRSTSVRKTASAAAAQQQQQQEEGGGGGGGAGGGAGEGSSPPPAPRRGRPPSRRTSTASSNGAAPPPAGPEAQNESGTAAGRRGRPRTTTSR
ncbi:hypothetical protein MNEG_10032 [Monoraphidium neglectum]|uniref:Uncharacterized protein n=1 Tax=Monoraphidium neglectum TaxID=145388 RepID=A0A0D2M2S1_9CHLO|nr:hypothetical protein MNEG_10032 [Monoraphidium neglectum]KIY97929.1 hypothetical protein MNEG_10032 [Monoraphidium neglectum]|eukprot:XP_013896949.1 hypothetical protein MNEG_10032 [Monoraphidium neglectum]